MKAAFKIVPRIVVFMAAVVAFCSCASDRGAEGQAISPELRADVAFSVSVPAVMKPETRALEASDESAVSEVDVFVFDAEGKLYDHGYGTQIRDASTGGNTVKTFRAALKPGEDLDVMVLANSRAVIEAAYPSGLSVGTILKSDFILALTITLPSDGWNAEPGSDGYMYVPMWGVREGMNIDGGTSLTGDNVVKISRMFARVNVSLAAELAESDFRLTSVRIYNYNVVGRVIPGKANGNWTAAVPRASVPTVPPQTMIKGPLHYATMTTADRELRNVVYLPEAAAGVAPGSAAGDFTENPCVVIGGEYKGGTETFYRVDFVLNDPETGLPDYLALLRNHSYNITVSSVGGPGKGDPDEALDSAPENIETGVTVWNDHNLNNIIFDGTNILAVSVGEFSFTREAYSESSVGNTLKIYTDYRSGQPGARKGWVIKNIVEVTDTQEGDVETPLTGEDAWLRFSLTEEAVPDSGEEQQTVVKLLVNANEGNTRRARFTIAAGRLEYVVNITQSDAQEVDIKIYAVEGGIPDGEVSMLDFAVVVGEQAGTKSFMVEWTPASADCRVVVSPLGSDMFSFAPGSDVVEGGVNVSGGRKIYTVTPGDLGGEGFYRKEMLAVFQLESGGKTAVGSFILRHYQYHAEIATEDRYMLDGGAGNKFTVRANVPWKVIYTGQEGPVVDRIGGSAVLNPGDVVAEGGYNLPDGKEVSFSTIDYGSVGGPQPMSGTVGLRLVSADAADPLFDDIYAELQCGAESESGEANCYMVDWNSPTPLVIPTSQVLKAMHPTDNNPAASSGLLPANWVTDFSKLRVQVLWSDINEFGSASSVVQDVALSGTSLADGKITVTPGKPVQLSGINGGNALIILYEEGGAGGSTKYDDTTDDAIKWSWHIWNTEYVPGGGAGNAVSIPVADGDGKGQGTVAGGMLYRFGGQNNNTWMDRNLGAIGGNAPGATFNAAASLGFIYQFGRKDPFPGSAMGNAVSVSGRTLYYAGGVPATGTAGAQFQSKNDRPGLATATSKPTWYYYSASPSHWCGTTPDIALWGGTGAEWNGIADVAYVDSTTGKSVYDPCPEGWKVPAGEGESGSGYSPWYGMPGRSFANGYGLDGAVGGYGYWPAAGYRNADASGLDLCGSFGYYYTNDMKYMYFRSNNVYIGAEADGQSQGMSVRCVVSMPR